jgi:NHLM bacteriocin system ABC transporter ATP-binding protein
MAGDLVKTFTLKHARNGSPPEKEPEEFLAASNRILRSRIDLSRPIRAMSGDGLLEACQSVAGNYQLRSAAPSQGPGEIDVQTRLERLLHASGLRQRKVALSGRWYELNCGPLLGFLREGVRPVALIPESARSYRLLDPVKNSSQKVTAALSGDLEPMGAMIYRPFPPGAVSGRKLLAHALRGNYADLVLIAVVGILAALLSLLVPIMTNVIFSEVIPSAERSQLLQIGAALLLAAFTSVMFQLTGAFALQRLEGKGDHAVQTAVWDRLFSLPAGFFRSYSAGDLANRADGINAMRSALSNTVVSYLLGAIFSVVNLAIIFWYSWQLALLALLLASIAASVDLAAALVQLKYQRRSLNLSGRLTGRIFQLLNGLAKWKTSATEERALHLWSSVFLEKKQADKTAGLIKAVATSFSTAYPIVTTLVNFGIYYFFLSAHLTTGSFMAYNAAFTQLISALLAATSATITLVNIIPLYERVRPILSAEVEQQQIGGDSGVLTGRVEMRNVGFRYDAESPAVLRNINFEVKPCEYLAIVGGSGAGKSSLVRILLGFEKPTLGEVLYDGQDLGELDVRGVRRQLGVVLQNDRILAGDIYHNIVGSHPRTMAEAWEAAAMAGVKGDIEMLPMGMQTFISEGGSTFSGGQLQRIIIARALVNRPPILIFDEATSALDNLTQAIVSDNLKKMNITRIVIAQRLSTIREADRLLVLEKGEIVETGTYDELMAQDGAFKKLAARQML